MGDGRRVGEGRNGIPGVSEREVACGGDVADSAGVGRGAAELGDLFCGGRRRRDDEAGRRGLGPKGMAGPIDVKGVGRIYSMQDPQGAYFSVVQMEA